MKFFTTIAFLKKKKSTLYADVIVLKFNVHCMVFKQLVLNKTSRELDLGVTVQQLLIISQIS